MIDFDSEGFDKFIEGQLANANFEVGVLDEKQRFNPRSPVELKDYAGGMVKVKKLGRQKSNVKNSELAKALDAKYKWLRTPFLLNSNRDIQRAVNLLVESLNGKPNGKALLNAIQGIVRNPILRGEYGRNKHDVNGKLVAKPRLISTSQFFRNIIARWVK